MSFTFFDNCFLNNVLFSLLKINKSHCNLNLLIPLDVLASRKGENASQLLILDFSLKSPLCPFTLPIGSWPASRRLGFDFKKKSVTNVYEYWCFSYNLHLNMDAFSWLASLFQKLWAHSRMFVCLASLACPRARWRTCSRPSLLTRWGLRRASASANCPRSPCSPRGLFEGTPSVKWPREPSSARLMCVACFFFLFSHIGHKKGIFTYSNRYLLFQQ